MAEMTMVGNWTGPHPSSINQPPTSTGVRPAGAHRSSPSTPAAPRSSSPPPPPATGRRSVSTAPAPVDIQICMALSGRPASLEGLTPEACDVADDSPLSAPAELSWCGKDSVVPLARPRAARATTPTPPPLQAVLLEPVPAPPSGRHSVAPVSTAPVSVPPVSAAPVSAARVNAAPVSAARPVAAPPAATLAPSARPAAPGLRVRGGWLLVALAALASVLVAGALLRVRAPIGAVGVVHAPLALSTVATEQPGLLLQLLARPGEPVVADQIVAQLATAPFEAELQLRWQAFLDLQGELAADETALLRDASAATLAHAAKGLVRAQSALAAASVRAPCSGTVEALVARPGSVVASGQPLLQLAPTGVGRSLIAFLPAEARSLVEPGARAEVLLPGEPGAPRSAEARVTRIAPQQVSLDELRATLPEARSAALVRVQLELRDAEPELLAGLRSGERVSVRLEGREQRLLSALLGSLRELLEPQPGSAAQRA